MKTLWSGALLALALLVLGGRLGPANAGVESFRTITAPEAKNMMEKEKAVLVNSLSAIEFEVQHIPGSINIPIIDMRTTDKLPLDKTTALIFYCMGLR